ncbi:MAG: GNAT family N-acetyltransferase [Acidimicrobiales bacterium]
MERETARLSLRPVGPDDLDGLCRLNADPEVMRFILDGSTLDREQTAARLVAMREHWQEHGYGIFGLWWRSTDEFVGWAGVATPTFLPEVMPAVEIGWRLLQQWWGRGVATEAARDVLGFAFDDIGLDRLVSIRHVDNDASGRVMAKLGFQPFLQTVVPLYNQPVTVSRLTAEEYRSGPHSRHRRRRETRDGGGSAHLR